MLRAPLGFPTVGEQKEASRRGRKGQQGSEQFFQVSLGRLNLGLGRVPFEPFAPVWSFLRRRAENEDAIPVARSEISLSHGSIQWRMPGVMLCERSKAKIRSCS